MRQGRGKVKGVVLEMGSLRGKKNGFFPTWCFAGWVFNASFDKLSIRLSELS